jgi:hypothetical protein
LSYLIKEKARRLQRYHLQLVATLDWFAPGFVNYKKGALDS